MKAKTLLILEELKTYFTNNLNNAIQSYNLENNTNLQLINSISYTNVTSQLPELFFTIDRTDFEYSNITKNESYTTINNCVLSLACRNNTTEFEADMEGYIEIIINLLMNYYSENINNLIISSVERGEMQDKNIQTIKIFVLQFKIYSYI